MITFLVGLIVLLLGITILTVIGIPLQIYIERKHRLPFEPISLLASFVLGLIIVVLLVASYGIGVVVLNAF